MNLHGIAAGAIGAVNPMVPGTIQVSTGYTTSGDGSRVPTYTTVEDIPMQVQALTFRDMQQTDSLNLQGTRRAIYIDGRVDGLVRPDNKGGDIITLTDGPNAGTWLVVIVLETWPDWTKVAVTLQNA